MYNNFSILEFTHLLTGIPGLPCLSPSPSRQRHAICCGILPTRCYQGYKANNSNCENSRQLTFDCFREDPYNIYIANQGTQASCNLKAKCRQTPQKFVQWCSHMNRICAESPRKFRLSNQVDSQSETTQREALDLGWLDLASNYGTDLTPVVQLRLDGGLQIIENWDCWLVTDFLTVYCNI